MSGYFPSVLYELYYYILLFGSIIILFLTKKNIYCSSVCPFGSVQDVLAKVGNAKIFRPVLYKRLRLSRDFIVLVALLLSLAFNNPVLVQYEVFGAFFQLTANAIIFGILIIVIILSLFIKRPWCNYMCPVDTGFEFIKQIRRTTDMPWKT
jgi:polyferredoxin